MFKRREDEGHPGHGVPVGDSTSTDLLATVREYYRSASSWHGEGSASASDSDTIAAKALHLHALNFDLWHHEEAVRRPGVSDQEVARRKRRIDDLNTRRNAAIEDIDLTLLERLDLNLSAPLYTETPGTIVDRLSVLTLRILHTKRAESSGARLAVLDEQCADLVGGLEQLLARLAAGHVRFKLYRQFKSAAPGNYCDLFERRDS
jgi:Protein of unknown function (DUF4254)